MPAPTNWPSGGPVAYGCPPVRRVPELPPMAEESGVHSRVLRAALAAWVLCGCAADPAPRYAPLSYPETKRVEQRDILHGTEVVNPANGHLYILLDQSNWTDAEAEAVLLGGHLATIDDAAEDSFVFDTFSTFGGLSRSLWIGLNDRASEGVLEWSSGAPVGYVNFDSSEPNNGGVGGEDCVDILGPSTAPQHIPGRWNDLPCPSLEQVGPLNGVVEIDDLSDEDDDGIPDALDNCPDTPNPSQDDADGDSAGDACDNCLLVNSDQRDDDENGIGDACDEFIDFLVDFGFEPCVCHVGKASAKGKRGPKTVCDHGKKFDRHLRHGDALGRCLE